MCSAPCSIRRSNSASIQDAELSNIQFVCHPDTLCQNETLPGLLRFYASPSSEVRFHSSSVIPTFSRSKQLTSPLMDVPSFFAYASIVSFLPFGIVIAKRSYAFSLYLCLTALDVFVFAIYISPPLSIIHQTAYWRKYVKLHILTPVCLFISSVYILVLVCYNRATRLRKAPRQRIRSNRSRRAKNLTVRTAALHNLKTKEEATMSNPNMEANANV